MKKNLKRLIIFFFIATSFLVVVNFSFAQTVDVDYAFTGNTSGTADDLASQAGLSTRDPRETIAFVINIILGFLGIIAVGLIIYAGFLWMTAAGNEDKITLAKKIMVQASIGLLIILSSFAIATFILRVLMGTTGGGNFNGSSGSNATSTNTNTSREFLLSNTDPRDQEANVIRNAEIRFYFNSPVNRGTVANNFNVSESGSITYENNNSTIVFTPDGACDTSLITTDICFPANTSITASVDNNLQRVNLGSLPVSLNCSASGAPCSITFMTGNSYDLNLPTGASCSTNGTQQCSNNNLLCASDFCTKVANDCLCQNAPIIDYITPVGFCVDDSGNNTDTPCTTEEECEYKFGSGAECSIATPNGAVGNMVTIGGRWFGDTPGKVLFSNGAEGISPIIQNSECSNFWSDNEIIVIVPYSAADGPITITSDSSYSDSTNDTRGPVINDFVVNNIIRPGVCKIEPEEGEYRDEIILHGVNFGTPGTDAPADADKFKHVLFGGINSLVQDTFSWNDTEIGTAIDGPQVPNIMPRSNIAVQVKSLDNVLGNSKAFKMNRSRFAPRIDNISPLEGAEGDYITIIGDNFGNEKGEIFFSGNDSAEVYGANGNLTSDNARGNFSFPAECSQNNIWNEKQIIVKVPSGLSGNAISVKVKTKNFNLAEVWGDDTNEEKFKVSSAGPKPGLCKIWPTNGVAGNTNKISFYGERFGDNKGSAKFYNATTTSITGNDNWNIDVDGTDIAKIEVSLDAETGEAKVLNSANKESNPLFFRVDSCLADNGSPKPNYCSSNSFYPLCCPQNTIMAGSCVDKSANCGIVLGTTYSQYYVEFSTAASNDIPCDSDLLTPMCEADNTFCEDQALTNSSNKVWCEPETCTCQVPGRPEVIVECNRREYECSNYNLPSPSPLTNDWDINRGKPLACTNAVITARFDQVMDLDSVNSNNIKLYECSPTGTSTCSTTSRDGNVVSGYADDNSSYLEFTARGGLSPDKWYKIQLNADNIVASSTKLKLVGGEPNNLSDQANSYVWYFKTRDSSVPCNIGCVTVLPNNFTARQQNQKINYKAIPDQEDNACIMISSTDYDWDWASNKTNKATIAYNLSNPYYTSTSTATALHETVIDDPVIISAEESDQQKIGTSTLNINFGFRVEEIWPVNDCEDVCLNADIGAKFSAEIDNVDLRRHPSLSKVQLFKCTNPVASSTNVIDLDNFTCNIWEDLESTRQVDLNPEVITATPQEMSFKVDDSSYVFLFEQNTVYKAVLVGGSSGIKSIEGSVIDNPNNSGNNYKWIFATGESICEVTDIEVKPEHGITTLVGQDLNYTSIPYSDQQLCLQDRKQRLRGENYNWEWHPDNSDSDLIAVLPPIGEDWEINNVIDLTGTSHDYNAENQKAEALGTGEVTSDPIYGMSQKTDVTAGIDSGTDGTSSIFDQLNPVEDSAEFILQCGWTNDSECHDSSGSVSDTYGVGDDTCCYQRPWAERSEPDDEKQNVCRNALLEVDFSDPMDVSSFASNVIVAAKFPADEPCPDGREYIIVYNNSNNKFAKTVKTAYNALTLWNNNIFFNSMEWIAEKMMNFSIIKEILAVSNVYAEDLGEKWCSVSGNVGGYNQYKNGGLKGVMTFAPTELLPTIETEDPNGLGREHIILIKGDDNLEDANRNGSVRNIYGVTMGKTDSFSVAGVICRGDIVDEDCAVNGQKFYGQAIKFTTIADKRNSSRIPLNYYGICLGDHVRVEEPSWLFKTREDDTRDNSAGSMYDIIHDSDKEFITTMMSRTGQALAGLAGYDWEWGWAPRDTDIIEARDASPSSAIEEDPNRKVAVVKQEARTRARTFFNATATITDNTLVGDISGLTNQGDTITGSADIRVFLCNNPWPVYDPGQTWPFIDQGLTCLSDTGDCPDTHFEFYYCRDKGQNGTSDDLPAISDNGAIRGYSNDIIKEFLFTRADIPNTPVLSLQAGGRELTWNNFGANYRLYYGTSEGNYTNSVNTENYYIGFDELDLADGNTYYFAIKAINSDGAESELSKEVKYNIGAVINPPTDLRANAFYGAKTVKLIWNKSIKNGEVDEEINDYKIYLDHHGDAKNDEQKLASDLDCSQTNEIMECDWQVRDSNQTYYFQVEALRGDEMSNKTDYIRVDFGPVGYWKINEGGSKEDIIDYSGFNNNGEFKSSKSLPDWENNVLNFRVGNKKDYIEILNPSNIGLELAGGFTFSAWIKVEDRASANSIISIVPDNVSVNNKYPNFIAGHHDGSSWVEFDLVGLRIYEPANPQNYKSNCIIAENLLAENTNIFLDNWNYTSLVYDKKNIFIYLNGQMTKSQQLTKECKPIMSDGDIYIGHTGLGGNNSHDYFSGNIADVKIYNHVRTASQIQDDYNGSRR